MNICIEYVVHRLWRSVLFRGRPCPAEAVDAGAPLPLAALAFGPYHSIASAGNHNGFHLDFSHGSEILMDFNGFHSNFIRFYVSFEML